MLHLLLHRETDTLVIVTDENYHRYLISDNEYAKIELREQMSANGITIDRILSAVENYVEEGIQTAIGFDFGANAKDETEKIVKPKLTPMRNVRESDPTGGR